MLTQAHLDAALLCAGATAASAVLVRAAPALGLVDDASDAPERKHHRQPVPLVGGLVLALVVGTWLALRGTEALPAGPIEALRFAPRAVLVALGLAFGTGLLDDRLPRGLGPAAKLAGQTTAGLALAFGASVHGAEPTLLVRAGVVLAALVAQNAANTFDNADGALTAVATTGLALANPLALALSGATLGFLPWNLVRRRGAATPPAWLGDAGSHLLGLLLLLTPIAWGALLLPLLDLARVSWERSRAGVPIWVGDRRHLAHRLAERGLGPVAVVGVLVVATLPGLLLARLLTP